MRARFDAVTDVAMIGAWDAHRGAEPFTAEESKRLSETLDAEATAGHLFVVNTGADGGGPVDVYIDEVVPPDQLARLTPLGDDCILALPSGSLVVDGVEQYRASKPATARSTDQAVVVEAGDYTLRCWVSKDDAEPTPGSEHDVEAIVGAGELRYYERITRLGCLAGFGLLLLFPLLLPFFGWKGAAIATIVTIVAFFNVREWLLRRSPRFMRLREAVVAARHQHRGPTFVLELRRATNSLR
jgi:hypothetical protein